MSTRGKYSEQQKISTIKYVSANLDRIEIKVPKGIKLELSNLAESNGTNLTVLIKDAIKKIHSRTRIQNFLIRYFFIFFNLVKNMSYFIVEYTVESIKLSPSHLPKVYFMVYNSSGINAKLIISTNLL